MAGIVGYASRNALEGSIKCRGRRMTITHEQIQGGAPRREWKVCQKVLDKER